MTLRIKNVLVFDTVYKHSSQLWLPGKLSVPDNIVLLQLLQLENLTAYKLILFGDLKQGTILESPKLLLT